MFKCKDCGFLLPASDYYYNKSGGRHHACKSCIKKKNVEKYKNDPTVFEKKKARETKYAEDPNWLLDRKMRSEKFYASLEGRAKLYSNPQNAESLNTMKLWILTIYGF